MTYNFLLSVSYESIIENIPPVLPYSSDLKTYKIVRKEKRHHLWRLST